jgi:hypothetical protein
LEAQESAALALGIDRTRDRRKNVSVRRDT